MASIENRSHYQVAVKNRDDLTQTFPHDKLEKAEAYRQSLKAQKLKPKLIPLDNHYMIRIRKKGLKEQVLYANSLKEAELVRAKLQVEHSQGILIDYSKGQNTTLAELMIRYLHEEAPRNKSFEIDAYKINAMLEDAGLQRQSIAEIVASHPNPCAKVKAMRIRKEIGKKMRPAACSATRFILKPFAQIVPDDLTEYVDERCQTVSESTVDRELDIFSAVCNIAIKTWRIHVLNSPMDGVKRPPYFNERDRRLKPGEEDRLLVAAFEEDEKWSQSYCHDQLVASELKDIEGRPTRYRFWQTRKQLLKEAQATWVHIPMYECFVQFQLMTGARRGESLSLRWANVDLDVQTAFLPETKNGRPRKLPLRRDLIELLRQLPRTNELVFEFSNDALRKAWTRMCECAGLTGEFDLHVHDLRHEAISRVAEIGSNTPGGFSLLDLQAFSGHRDVRMLLRYAHLCAQGLAKRLDDAFRSKDPDKQFNSHHGRKRLNPKVKVTLKDVIDHAVAEQPVRALEDHSHQQTASMTTPSPAADIPSVYPATAENAAPSAENVIHVNFRRQAA
ncbi:phage integrase family protein [Janthinobacterium sp. HH104]|uniref:site-specific integrase n=1 Tax=Janthinobacterium sp. HH104 TaxID=1537276 RepID=UPI0008756A0B|nr:site-specific integrase [Janthinobacterium sp. HH104]OEZ83342.1 phage integrase family protein [Janthinobacterium sp. HH104]